MNRILQLIALLGVVFLASACSQGPEGSAMSAKADDSAVLVGGLYTSQSRDGKWHVTKILAIDGDTVHVRMYSNEFAEQPRSLDPNALTLGSIGSGRLGIGHAPIAKAGFLSEKRTLVSVVPVTSDELEGYRYYLDAMRETR